MSILWEDHQQMTRTKIMADPDETIIPTLSVGILYRSTKKYFILVSDIERYEDRDDASYMIIHKPVLAKQEYGEIEIDDLRQ